MIRGRHRGLPVAIDRAIVLPYEFQRTLEDYPDPPPGVDDHWGPSMYNDVTVPEPIRGPADDIASNQDGRAMTRAEVGG